MLRPKANKKTHAQQIDDGGKETKHPTKSLFISSGQKNQKTL
jgi:hypothetical protein